MSTPARRFDLEVVDRTQVSEHLVRLVLGGPALGGPDGLVTTGSPDEWVGLVVPGQFQSRYYTVRTLTAEALVLDVVVHDEGLVTGWASTPHERLVGQTCTVTEPQASFDPPPGAGWLMLVGDLTALPAMARIVETTALPVRVWAEVADGPEALGGYLPGATATGAAPDVTWLTPPAEGGSTLAAVVEALDWPAGEGYFWMAGESAQMRAIRKHLMRGRRLPSTAYDVMGYWRGGAARQPRAVDRRVAHG